jgi:hypothetical protein
MKLYSLYICCVLYALIQFVVNNEIHTRNNNTKGIEPYNYLSEIRKTLAHKLKQYKESLERYLNL